LAPKAPKKKIEHVAAKWLTLFCPSQAKPRQAKFGAEGAAEKN
jgi:hypothetical protein